MKALFERAVALALAMLTVVVLVYLTFSEYDRRLLVARNLELMQSHVGNDQIFSAILCEHTQSIERSLDHRAPIDCPKLLRQMLDGDALLMPDVTE